VGDPFYLIAVDSRHTVARLSRPQAVAASLRARSAESWGMQRQTKITIGEVVLLLVIAAEVVIFIGYTDPGHSILNSLAAITKKIRDR
jgi:hypothetical protein